MSTLILLDPESERRSSSFAARVGRTEEICLKDIVGRGLTDTNAKVNEIWDTRLSI